MSSFDNVQPAVTSSEERNRTFDAAFTKDAIIRPLFTTTTPVILDIGAHKGESISRFASAFPDCKIISVEPNPELVGALTADYGDRATIIEKAVAACEGTIDLFVNEQTGTSSLLRINEESRDSITIQDEGIAGLGAINKQIQVESTTIDAIARSHDLNSIELIKIDVQGAELDVLRGASRSLAITSVIEVEISFFDFWESSTTFRQIEEILHPAGFSLYSLPFVSQNPMNGRTDWVDAIYARR